MIHAQTISRAIRGLLIACALALASSSSVAHAQPWRAKDLSGDLRYHEQRVDPYVINTATVAGTVGSEGTLVSAVMTAATGVSWTSSIACMPYPAALRVLLLDGNTDDTLACQSIYISGIAQDGSALVYSHSNLAASGAPGLDETGVVTPQIFSRVDRVIAHGCGALGDSSDRLMVVVSGHIGFERPVKQLADFDGICAEDTNVETSERCVKMSACSTRALSGRPGFDYFDATTCVFPGLGTTGAPREHDKLHLRYRSPTR